MKYQLDNYEIDTQQYSITSAGLPISVEPKVFDLIVYLIEHRENLISRDELFTEIWDGREVSDTTLSNHIKSARKVLGDNGERQDIIKTIRGRGYQFIAQIDEMNEDEISKLQVPNANKFLVRIAVPVVVIIGLVGIWVFDPISFQNKGVLTPAQGGGNKTSPAKLGSLPTNNIQAYEYYIAGQQLVSLLEHQSLRRAIELFSQAVKLDPNFEEAYIAKANAYRLIMSYFETPANVLPNVIDSVLETLAVNSESAKAYSALGLAYVLAWRWQDAWDMLNTAKSIDPSLAQTELGFAMYYAAIGEKEKVINALNVAKRLDPLNVEIADWGNWALMMSGSVEAALTWSSDQMRLHPKTGMIYSGASVTASIAKQYPRAITLAKEGVKLDPQSAFAYLALAQAFGWAGQTEKIQPLLDKANNLNSYICPYESAVNYILLNNKEKAFEHLNDAVEARSNCLVFTRNDPRLQPLRDDPRFNALLTRIGLDSHAIRNYSR